MDAGNRTLVHWKIRSSLNHWPRSPFPLAQFLNWIISCFIPGMWDSDEEICGTGTFLPPLGYESCYSVDCYFCCADILVVSRIRLFLICNFWMWFWYHSPSTQLGILWPLHGAAGSSGFICLLCAERQHLPAWAASFMFLELAALGLLGLQGLGISRQGFYTIARSLGNQFIPGEAEHNSFSANFFLRWEEEQYKTLLDHSRLFRTQRLLR